MNNRKSIETPVLDLYSAFPHFFNNYKKEELKDKPFNLSKENISSVYGLKNDQIYSITVTEKNEIKISFNKEIDSKFLHRLRLNLEFGIYSSSEDFRFKIWNPDVLPFILIPSNAKALFTNFIQDNLDNPVANSKFAKK